MDKRHKVKHREPLERIKDFFEVAVGLDEKSAKEEASRCLQCKARPCTKGCPVEVDIPSFIKLIKEGNVQEALDIIKEKN
ncbi:MAG TPA: hypothetical protein PLU24_05700 [Candidatus Omnitrophota bacterium]|nr:hypothetical protein [Candidatus Omnitrophota bacterium]